MVGCQDHQCCDENERLLRGLIELRARSIASSRDSSLAYDRLHAAGQLRQRDSFYRWLLRLLRARPGQTLLDVSCGQGSLLLFAARQGLRAVGCDLSPVAVMATTRQSRGTAGTIADAEQLPYAPATFDYVTNIGSLEHYSHPHWAVREIARVLRPNGKALILTPNTFGLLSNILYAWRHGDVYDDGQPIQRYGTNAQWRRLLELNGLKVGRAIRYERAWPRTFQDLFWYILHPHRVVRVALSAAIPVNLSSFLVYLCSKAG